MTRVSDGAAGVDWSEGRGPLPLSDAQRNALSALEQFANAVGDAEAGAAYLLAGAGVGSLMIRASGAVLAATLPDCPEAPSGSAVGEQWSFHKPYRLILRCEHNPPHCWDRIGNPTSC